MTVPTPIDAYKQPDLTQLISASKAIGGLLKQNDIVVYVSTVYPGATEEVCILILEATSGRTFNKAVRPTNVMGATKRLAELVCQGFSQDRSNQHTCISMVRFGNVLGSSGSVVPLFTKQIEKGHTITVTHPDVTRYFMTIPEAANLVIQAGAMATGGEVFVLDMGAPVKIVDLAKRMVHLSGFEVKDNAHPHGDIEIVFTRLRPGEKLYEELIIGEDNVKATHHPLIMQAIEYSFQLNDIEATLDELAHRAQSYDVEWLKQRFKHFVAGYQEGTPADNLNTNTDKVIKKIV